MRVNMINLSTDAYPSPNGEFTFVKLRCNKLTYRMYSMFTYPL
jgi:hypothetical protein